jgi:7-cyano-7-deazaguanine synthase
MRSTAEHEVDRVAVLASGGLDSAILIAELARSAEVYPLYVAAGLVWERDERDALRSFLEALACSDVRPVVELTAQERPLIGAGHWSVSGRGIPEAGEPDEASFIPGRNVLLLAMSAIWCSTHGVHRLAIGSLGGNPFPDATPEFLDAFGRALSLGLAHEITIEAPFRGRTKADLIAAHADLPLELTLTCADPRDGGHCGVCSKCVERHSAFVAAGVPDSTGYAVAPMVAEH